MSDTNKTSDDNQTITISIEEYEGLLDEERRLYFLRAAGVDNWNGYDYAIEMYREWKTKNQKQS